MFCPKCGQQIPDNSFFCPVCGANVQGIGENGGGEAVNTASDKSRSFFAGLKSIFVSNKFLALCIVLSVSVVCNAITGFFDLVTILFAVGLWMMYANAKKNEPVMNISGIKMTVGMVKFLWVVMWIAVAFSVIGAIFFIFAAPVLSAAIAEVGLDAIMSEVMTELEFEFWGVYEAAEIEAILRTVFENIQVILTVMGIALIVCAVIYVLINIFCYGKIKNFAVGIKNAYERNEAIELNYNSARKAVIFLGVINAISLALGLGSYMLAVPGVEVAYSFYDVLTLVCSACNVALCFIGASVIKSIKENNSDSTASVEEE